MKFYKCLKCGHVMMSINDHCDNVTCCDCEMKLLNPLEFDGVKEKHVPITKINGNTLEVIVGEIPHPMEEEHYIEFIAYQHDNSITIINLNYNDKPEVKFNYLGEGVVYAYCNKHGLWKTDI